MACVKSIKAQDAKPALWTPHIIGYAAALLDKSIFRISYSHPGRDKWTHSVTLNSRDNKNVEWMAYYFGGPIRHLGQIVPGRSEPTYACDLRFCNRDLPLILETCLPFMISRKDQAEIMFEFTSTFQGKKSKRVSDNITEYRHMLMGKLMNLRELSEAEILRMKRLAKYNNENKKQKEPELHEDDIIGSLF